ncbi:MAG: hypothetical protein H5T96_07255 [Tissierellales bacterium]|nr:hypothetical protein [Tissierellales bacterium]
MIYERNLFTDLEKQLQIKTNNIVNKANITLLKYITTYSDFLDPYELKIVYQNLKSFSKQINIVSYGGYEDSERKKIIFYPLWEDIKIDEYIDILSINGNFENISHRDALGSIMSLGIRREKLGDILIYRDKIILITSPEISDFIIANLQKIKNSNVKNIEKIATNDFEAPISKFMIIKTIVGSLRLDSIVAAICNISRAEAQNLVKKGLVNVNWEISVKVHQLLESEDLISVKGYGRFRLSTIGSKTKNGRIHIDVKKYL